MGQYQQWLHYREVDQYLRAQLEALETELAQLQNHSCHLEQNLPTADNQIIRALATMMAWETPTTSISPAKSTKAMNPPNTPAASYQLPQEISPGLQQWGTLLDFSPQEMQESFRNSEELPARSNPHAEMILLPEDVEAVFDEHAQTQPQLELPWWLHNIMISTGTLDLTSPIDQESIRTNRLVQRWLERWGRRPPTQQMPQEDQIDG